MNRSRTAPLLHSPVSIDPDSNDRDPKALAAPPPATDARIEMTSTLNTALAHQAATLAAQSFCIPEVAKRLAGMSREELDALDFGAVQVDGTGVIEKYNRYEQELGGVTEEEVRGKSFFSEVAICTNNALFKGVFAEGIRAGNLNHLFPYTFTYKMSPTPVRVRRCRDTASQTNWSLVKRS